MTVLDSSMESIDESFVVLSIKVLSTFISLFLLDSNVCDTSFATIYSDAFFFSDSAQ